MMMTTDFFTTPRIAGALLLLGLLLILLAVALIAVQGRLAGMAAAFRGVGPETGDVSALRTMASFQIPATIGQVAGFALLTVLLFESGDHSLPAVALALVVLSWTLWAIDGTFNASVTVWAAEEAARTGVTPEFYEPIRRWVHNEIGLVAYVTFFAATAAYGWSALRTGYLSPWLNWAVLAWSLIWILLAFLKVGLPAFVILPPLVFGVGLLLRG